MHINGKQVISITISSDGYVNLHTNLKLCGKINIPLIRSRASEVLNMLNYPFVKLTDEIQYFTSILHDVGLPISWVANYGFARACKDYILFIRNNILI
jgi:hypothetical protein